ncbi:MAG: L-threonylcarbamoyladenylate synthase [Candidatus Micrarchaeota archaeon]|nr:L-threonylcarbamoyladenylate synthase [Candidatus Micrarchaeota archaeon]
MKRTLLIKIENLNSIESKLKKAAVILRKGGTVAFPTETVYGLGADAFNPDAVKKIFKAKNRPFDDPLIVHIADLKDLNLLTPRIPRKAKLIIDNFWPGPITLVLKKRKSLPDITTGGLPTVAVRMPAHKIALELIKLSQTPIAAPSANLFGKPSPTSAKHVIEDLYGKIDAIIDAGDTKIGVESTVVDLTVDPPAILRPGGITREQLEKVVGKVKVLGKDKLSKDLAKKSPGTKYRHYAPKAKLILVVGEKKKVRQKIKQLLLLHKRKKIGILPTSRDFDYQIGLVKFAGQSQKAVARRLFAIFREFDKEGVDLILAEGVEEKGLGLAILNRMKKAAHKIIHV